MTHPNTSSTTDLQLGYLNGNATDITAPTGTPSGSRAAAPGWQNPPSHLELPPRTGVDMLFGGFDANGLRDILATAK